MAGENNTSTFQWWKQQPSTRFGTKTNVVLSNGSIDVEKGNIYNAPAGTPIAIPVQGRIAWEDSQHVVIQTTQGILNLLHVNPTKPVGTYVQPNQPFGQSSAVVGSYTDPTSHITYTEYPGSSSGIIEAGLYDTVKRAIMRDNPTSPYDFTGIKDPTLLFTSWASGKGPQFSSMSALGSNADTLLPTSPGTETGSSYLLPYIIIVGGIVLLLLLLRR